MHGRPRKDATPEEQKASAIKAEKLRSLQSQILHYHHNRIYTKEALELSAELIEANPEYLTAWNYRKLAVEHNISQSETQADPETIKSILDQELRLVELALKRNLKSYGAWHHRRWVLKKGHSSTDRELQLLRQFQKLDTRNFHAWNYRRFVTTMKNVPDEEELEYTTNMIYDNFSNYSAWHNRSVLLSHLLEKEVQGFFPMENVLSEEFDFVRHALFTDPDDQSGWFYYLWLLDQTVKSDAPWLVSSWPPHGSTINVALDGSLDDCAFSPFTSFKANCGTFPLILYFNEVVEGISSSSVTVEFEHDANSDLNWRPLSTHNFGCAQAWVTHLKLADDKINSSKAFPVKVSIGNSRGIVSLRGVHYSHPCYILFTLCVQPPHSEHAEGHDVERISWRNENFCAYVHFQESSLPNLYHQLRVNEDDGPTVTEWNAQIIANEIDHCRELLSTVNCKIGKLTLARLLMAYDVMILRNNQSVFSTVHFEEVLELFRDLVKLDPPHSQYYQDEHSLVTLKQLTSSGESLLRYLHQYRDSTSSSINYCIGLRLNNLSLSKIGCIEQLLWVQMLDLSNNQLKSIEGLEAMQLLCFLNLSNNKLSSFTALEPLKLLKSLKVLNISCNQIGEHTIDTRRYLCSSPLSHTVGSDWNIKEFDIPGVEVTNYWEAFLIFRGLNLIQLDIVGNAVADTNFKLFLFRLLPKLKWLDDETLH